MTPPTPADIELPALPEHIASTAPERIWLDIGEAKSFIGPDDTFTTLMAGETTWSEDNATGCGIEYVRADRARTAASCAVPAGWKIERVAHGVLMVKGPSGGVLACAESMGPRVIPEEILHALASALLDAPATVRAERADAATVELTVTTDAEQAAFEDWMHRVCPSGDHESVQRQWLESSDYADLWAEPAPVVQPVAAYGVADFFRDAKRMGLTAADIAPALAARPEFADCLPEGCTPADARVLREANHALAVEVQQLREALGTLCDEQDARQGHASIGAYDKARAALARAVPAPTAGDAGGARE
jgi:hypothetical protein